LVDQGPVECDRAGGTAHLYGRSRRLEGTGAVGTIGVVVARGAGRLFGIGAFANYAGAGTILVVIARISVGLQLCLANTLIARAGLTERVGGSARGPSGLSSTNLGETGKILGTASGTAHIFGRSRRLEGTDLVGTIARVVTRGTGRLRAIRTFATDAGADTILVAIARSSVGLQRCLTKPLKATARLAERVDGSARGPSGLSGTNLGEIGKIFGTASRTAHGFDRRRRREGTDAVGTIASVVAGGIDRL
jgi:hypothetical protein